MPDQFAHVAHVLIDLIVVGQIVAGLIREHAVDLEWEVTGDETLLIPTVFKLIEDCPKLKPGEKVGESQGCNRLVKSQEKLSVQVVAVDNSNITEDFAELAANIFVSSSDCKFKFNVVKIYVCRKTSQDVSKLGVDSAHSLEQWVQGSSVLHIAKSERERDGVVDSNVQVDSHLGGDLNLALAEHERLPLVAHAHFDL